MLRRVIVRFAGLHFFLRQSLVRLRCWRWGLRHVDYTAYVGPRCVVHPSLRMARYSFVNLECVIESNVSIGAYTMLAPRVAIVASDHRTDVAGTPAIFSGRDETKPTIIEEDVWIGYGAIIIGGVTIGRGAMVGAGSVVTRDVPPYEVWAGVPARRMRERFDAASREVHDRMLCRTASRGAFCPPQ
jgi:acetyltransferase-like isoleucine patch superfamily enzyme